MTISTMSLALNVGIGFTVWMSDLSLVAKVILTVILLAKAILFFFTAWLGDTDKIRKAGTSALIILNIGIIVYSIICQEYFVAVTTATTLVMLGIWAFATIIDFDFKREENK